MLSREFDTFALLSSATHASGSGGGKACAPHICVPLTIQELSTRVSLESTEFDTFALLTITRCLVVQHIASLHSSCAAHCSTHVAAQKNEAQ